MGIPSIDSKAPKIYKPERSGIFCGIHGFCVGTEGTEFFCYGKGAGCLWHSDDCSQDSDCAKYDSSSAKYTDGVPACDCEQDLSWVKDGCRECYTIQYTDKSWDEFYHKSVSNGTRLPTFQEMKRFCKHRGRIAGIVPVGDENTPEDERWINCETGLGEVPQQEFMWYTFDESINSESECALECQEHMAEDYDGFFVDRITGVCVCRECDGG